MDLAREIRYDKDLFSAVAQPTHSDSLRGIIYFPRFRKRSDYLVRFRPLLHASDCNRDRDPASACLFRLALHCDVTIKS